MTNEFSLFIASWRECRSKVGSERNNELPSEATEKIRGEMATKNIKLRIQKITENINDADETFELNEVG